MISPTSTIGRTPNAPLPHPESSSLDAALQWLVVNEYSNGSYGAYLEHWAAAAAYALWQNDSSSAKAATSYLWLASQLNSSSAWFWGTEADVPGAMLYSVVSSGNLHLINETSVEVNFLQLQQPHSGFEGYYDSTQGATVTSSVDTDMALLGLISAAKISSQNETDAIRYLRSLQNQNGSFNLTSSIPFDPLYSLGPDPIAITALTVLTLKSAGLSATDPYVSKGLAFLSKVASTGFGGHVYAAAVSDLAFTAYNDSDNAVSSMLFILSRQNCDGGFSDISRSSYPQSNALDTGWVATALETQYSGENGNTLANNHRINCAPVANFFFTPSAPSVGSAIHFNASASHDFDSDMLSYNWTFGDGTRAQGVSPTHTYSQASNFTVTLTVTDSGTNPGPLSDTKPLTISVQQTIVQKTSTLTLSASGPWIIVGVVGLVGIIGVAFYVGRKSGRIRVAPF